jgi:hypothetical protein
MEVVFAPLKQGRRDPMGVAQEQAQAQAQAQPKAAPRGHRDGACTGAILPPVSICEQSFFGHKSAVDIDML